MKDDLYQVSEEVDNNAGPDSEPMPYQFLNMAMTNSHNFYAGMKVSYEYKDIVALSASGTYRNWDTKEDYALLLKPASEFNFNATFKPIKELGINVGFDYIGREEVKDFGKLSAISNLYAGANYNIYKGVSVYARINNLLNKKYQYYLGYPTEGFNFVGGLSFSF